MDATELLSSIEIYKNQLQQVNLALESAEEKNKAELQELQLNLIQVLELTLNQIEEFEKNSETSTIDVAKTISDSNKSSIEQELELFKHEISLLDGPSSHELESGTLVTSNGEQSDDLETSLNELEGKEVRAPYVEKWGGHSYHNAIIFKIIVNDEESGKFEPKAHILYSQPTDICMVPCKYFLNGNCTFSDRCKFSHGKEIPITDLKDYVPPDKDLIVEESLVLVQHDYNDVWHRATVQDVLQNRAGFSVNCKVCRKVVEANLEKMIPLSSDEDLQDNKLEGENLVENSSLSEEDSYTVSVDTCLTNQLSSRLGDWEKHTKGIGSKLMAKMGYIVGTGLGPSGDGRIDPVPVYAYPQGVSLDRCMELRLNSNGEDFYQVEKRLLKQQKKEMEKIKKREEKLSQQTSVFDIINNKLSVEGASTSKNDERQVMNVGKKSLKEDSIKELNKKTFQLSSRINQLKSEIQKLVTSKGRHKNDTVTVNSLDKKLEEKRKELSSLQQAEKNVENEQLKRKSLKKLTSF